MLAWYMPGLCVHLCLCPSVTSGSSIESAEQTELVLDCELPFTYPTPCYKEILVPPNYEPKNFTTAG